MGDNRDNSADSRGSNGFHAIPLENLIGKVEYVLFSIKPEEEGQPPAPDLGNRFLIPVQ